MASWTVPQIWEIFVLNVELKAVHTSAGNHCRPSLPCIVNTNFKQKTKKKKKTEDKEKADCWSVKWKKSLKTTKDREREVTQGDPWAKKVF